MEGNWVRKRLSLGGRFSSSISARVFPIDGVVSHTALWSFDGELIAIRDGTTRVAEYGGSNTWKKSSAPKLRKHDRRALREIYLEQALLFLRIFVVASVRCFAAVVTPARGFGEHGFVHLSSALEPAGSGWPWSERSPIEQMFLSAVGKGEAKFGVRPEFLRQPEWHFIRIADGVVIQVLQDLFAIPNDILERQRWRPAVDGVPVLIFADVLIAGVIVQKEVVNEFRDVEKCLQFFVLGVVREIMH